MLSTKRKRHGAKPKKKTSKKHWAHFRRVKSKLKSVIKNKYHSYIPSLGSVCKTNPKILKYDVKLLHR